MVRFKAYDNKPNHSPESAVPNVVFITPQTDYVNWDIVNLGHMSYGTHVRDTIQSIHDHVWKSDNTRSEFHLGYLKSGFTKFSIIKTIIEGAISLILKILL